MECVRIVNQPGISVMDTELGLGAKTPNAERPTLAGVRLSCVGSTAFLAAKERERERELRVNPFYPYGRAWKNTAKFIAIKSYPLDTPHSPLIRTSPNNDPKREMPIILQKRALKVARQFRKLSFLVGERQTVHDFL